MAAHLNYYEVLGLDAPPADRKAVKRAYSKMLKITRPEDDPEGFMQLRDAHDLALNILAQDASNASWGAQQVSVQTSYKSEQTDGDTLPQPSLTYGDMLPEEEPVSDTSYSIGPTPNLDAPVTLEAFTQAPSEPLIEDLNTILNNPTHYNDREHWNILFRKARQLDIDDYVDFEQLLLDHVLRFHGFFDDHPNYNTPEKMPQKLSPSIAASLFKTMSWDQVNKHGYYRGQQIEWLERRMNIRKRAADPVPIPETDSSNTGKVWIFLIGIFLLAKLIQALANS